MFNRKIRKTRRMAKEEEKSSTAESFDEWCQRFSKDGGGTKMLMKEYEAIRAIPTPALCEALQQNSALNRYNNIHLIDQSRVVLTDGFQPDYIHANWVDGYKTKNSYILTQAPTEPSVKDYWRMVWQERARVIVCLTSLKEKGSCKADLFFPTSTETPFRAGPPRLILMGIEEVPNRRVSILHMKFYCWFGKSGRERDIAVVFYGDWPDRAVPTDTGSFLDLLAAVESLQAVASRQATRAANASDSWKPPVVVNCSAGVGRSATLVACQIEIDRLRDTGTVIDPQGTVRRLRTQRAGAVQNYVQYSFICRVIVEAAERYGAKKEGSNRSQGGQ